MVWHERPAPGVGGTQAAARCPCRHAGQRGRRTAVRRPRSHQPARPIRRCPRCSRIRPSTRVTSGSNRAVRCSRPGCRRAPTRDAPRVTISGLAERLVDTALKARYLAIHPDAASMPISAISRCGGSVRRAATMSAALPAPPGCVPPIWRRNRPRSRPSLRPKWASSLIATPIIQGRWLPSQDCPATGGWLRSTPTAATSRRASG